MMKTKVLKFINPLIGILMINQILTALFRESLPFNQFGMIHGYGGYLLSILVMVHLGLNWSWLKANYFRRYKVKNLKTDSMVQ